MPVRIPSHAIPLTAIALVLALNVANAGQVGPTSGAPPGPRTGMLVGQVIDAATGQPASEAIVTLSMPKYQPDLPTTPKGRVMADGEGRFFFTDLPAGEYYLQSTKDGYASGSYGQRKPSASGQRVTLGEGQRRTDIELPVWKYAVIAGTVVDEAGEPVVGIAVKALARNVVAGRTRYGNVDVISEPVATTDDRGMFRLAQLSPGNYVVFVPSTQTTVPAARLENPDAALRTDLFWGGIQEMTPLGQPRTLQMGEFALMTQNRVLIPPPPASSGRMQVYRTTFFPAAATAGAATPVTVKAGEERTDLTINLRPGPAMRVSGRLVTPDGSTPPPMMIRLVGEAMTDVTTFGLPSGPNDVGLETVTGLSDSRGRFMLLGVPPGEYILQHANRFLARPLQQGKPSYWVSQPITVGREDVSDLAVQLRPALRVEGRFEFRRYCAQVTPPPRIGGMAFETVSGEPGQFFAEVDREELTFATVAAGGRYIARPAETGGWFVHSVTLDSKDVTDRSIDLQSDATSFVVTYTDRSSKVSGTVTDAGGAPSATAVVLAFPIDQQRWSGYGGSPRTLKSSFTTRAGVYTFEHLPPGDYYLIAVENADADGWQDPSRLEALATRATRLSVAASDSLKTLDLRVRSIQ